MPIALEVMLILFGGLALIGVPLSFAAGAAALSYFIVSGQSVRTVVHQFYTSTDSFILLAVPLFIMAGHVMKEARITDQIIDLSSLVVGPISWWFGSGQCVCQHAFWREVLARRWPM